LKFIAFKAKKSFKICFVLVVFERMEISLWSSNGLKPSEDKLERQNNSFFCLGYTWGCCLRRFAFFGAFLFDYGLCLLITLGVFKSG